MEQAVLAIAGPLTIIALVIWSVNRLFRRFEGFRDPRTLGLIAEQPTFECHGPAIGRWGDHPLYEFIVARERRFEYDRLVGPDYRYRVSRDELFVAPGMVYVAR